MLIVSGGCTKCIWPPDVSWNAPFKELVTERYHAWMAEGFQEYNGQENLKGPTRRL